MNTNGSDWILRGQRFLAEKADKAFRAWLNTDSGRKWSQRTRRRSPYLCGFSLPDWHTDAIRMLGEGNEHEFKAIMLQNL